MGDLNVLVHNSTLFAAASKRGGANCGEWKSFVVWYYILYRSNGLWHSFSLPGVIKLGWSGLLYAYCRRGQQLQVGFSVLNYLQNLSISQRGFGRGARVVWEQQLQFGLPNLMCTIQNVHLFYRSRRVVWLRASAPSMRLTLGYFGLLYRSNWNVSAWCGSMGCRWVCTISSMQQVYCPPPRAVLARPGAILVE